MSVYKNMRYKGHRMIDLAVEWFKMDNDTFAKVYGFNFNPHQYPGLYEEARKIVYPHSER